jgi:hypothetical protein
MKKNRSNALQKMQQAAEKANSGKKNYGDDSLWKATVDKAGNGYAVLRFLPAAEGQTVPWVQYWDHGFQGPGGRWYIERSLTSIGQQDPVSEANSVLWATGLDEDRAIVRDRKRRLHYVANVLVVSDKGSPDNEGKVMKFQFGKKIFDKIMDVMQPEFEDETPLNPFDFWEGADFKLKIRQVEGYRNYDKSEFSSPSELENGDEDRLEVIYDSLHDLTEYTDPTKYKTYDELLKHYNSVVGVAEPHRSEPAPEVNSGKVESEAPIESVDAQESESVDADMESALDYFKNME